MSWARIGATGRRCWKHAGLAHKHGLDAHAVRVTSAPAAATVLDGRALRGACSAALNRSDIAGEAREPLLSSEEIIDV